MEYSLNIQLPDGSVQAIPISTKIALGNGKNSTVKIDSQNIAPVHCTFRYHNDVLTIHNSGGNLKTILGTQHLDHNKMYILEVGDTLLIGDLTINIGQFNTGEELSKLKELEELENKTEIDESITDIKTEENIDPGLQLEDLTPEITLETPIEKTSSKPKKQDPDERKTEVVDFNKIIKKEKEKFQTDKGKDRKIKKAKVSHTIKKRPLGLGHSSEAPNFLLRIYAFFTNIIFSYFIIFSIFPIFEINQYVLKFTNRSLPIIYNFLDLVKTHSPYPIPYEYIPTIFKYIFSFIVYDFSLHLLLGSSLTLFLLGVGTDDTFILARLKGLIRSLISILTFPFLIFDLPAVVGRSTLKEIITFSSYQNKAKFIKYISVVIIFPVMIIVGLLGPLINDSTLTTQLNKYYQQTVSGQFSFKQPFVSTKLSFKIENNNEIVFTPSNVFFKNVFNVRRPAPDNNYDLKLNLKNSSINILKMISIAQTGNPLFIYSFPKLSTYYKLTKKLGQKSSVKINKGINKEIKQLLQVSFDLNLETNIFEQHILRHGPFINGFVALRNHLNQILTPTISNKKKLK